MLVRVGDGPTHQVPLTYRGAPLDGGDGWLVGTAEHSVLGRRWVYDARGTPFTPRCWPARSSRVAARRRSFPRSTGDWNRRESTMSVIGSGGQDVDVPAVDAVRRVVEDDPTLIVTDSVELAVVRRLDGSSRLAGATLTGTWSGQPTSLPLAYALPR